MRVSLAPASRRVAIDAQVAKPASPLDEAGPEVIVGRVATGMALSEPVRPDRITLFGPRGACLADEVGPLFVCDTGHHRLMVWNSCPTEDCTPADFQIGQKDFDHEGRNGGGAITASTLNVPTGVASENGVLAVADAWNHRVLLWYALPTKANQPADVVLGQADFNAGLINRGRDVCSADTMNWCYCVSLVNGRLIVCDTGNRRVLVWNTIPNQNGAPADLVIGQKDFITRDENSGGTDPALGMRWPHSAVLADGKFFVADAGNNRVMVWRNMPSENGKACDYVLGQATMYGMDHNRAAYYPTEKAFNMPYGLARAEDHLLVVDTANSRLTSFSLATLAMDVPADGLAGQIRFVDKGDNRWREAVRDSLCWPYNVAVKGKTAVIADSGNNRILLWKLAP
jgi:hypothetical protein